MADSITFLGGRRLQEKGELVLMADIFVAVYPAASYHYSNYIVMEYDHFMREVEKLKVARAIAVDREENAAWDQMICQPQ